MRAGLRAAGVGPFALAAVVLAPVGGCAVVPEPASPGAPLALVVGRAPTAVPMGGARRIRYELHVTNTADDTVSLHRLDVLDAGRDEVLAVLPAEALARAAIVLPAGLPTGPVMLAADARTTAPMLRIAPQERLAVYLDLEPPADGAPPRALSHRIEVAVEGRAPRTVTGATTRLRTDRPPVLGPPLRGGPWVAVHHPAWPRGHRRVFYAVDGQARIPGRFAVDWIRVDEAGRTTAGDPDSVGSWLGYGADVLAVADAVVAATRDDVAESARLSTHPDHPLADATGNYVALDLGAGHYVFYEHLAPGSIRVSPGDRVRRGEPIAAVGYTGHTTGPHLHLHVADANSPLGAEGVPFLLACYRLRGDYASIEALGRGPWTPALPGPTDPTGIRREDAPAMNTVVDLGC